MPMLWRSQTSQAAGCTWSVPACAKTARVSSEWCSSPANRCAELSAAKRARWRVTARAPRSAGGSALYIVVVVALHPRHQLSQLPADGLDGMPLRRLPERLELRRTGVLILNEALSERAALDVAEHALHVLFDTGVDDPRPGDVIAVLSGIGNAPAHLGNAAFIHQVDDQLELVKALEIRHFRLVAGFGERLETRRHQCRNAAAQNRLLAEQIGLGLLGERGLDAAGA